jgi:hypothetical protein
MNNPDTDLLFPMRVIPSLADVRANAWQDLVTRVLACEDTSPQKIAFSLFMVKLAGCLGCSADSFRALRGCTQCARLAVKRYKGSDDELIAVYTDSLDETTKILEKREKLVVTN